MNIEAFTGRAEAYVKARPGYSDEAMDYIRKLAPPGAVFADIGAGTGIFTALLARYGCEIFAVEPNADMREQLIVTLAPFPKVKIVDGTAEVTTLADHRVDVIANAQALNRFDLDKFKIECLRIGKLAPLVISVYNANEKTGKNSPRYKKSTEAFYKNPAVREFPNPLFFTRDKWLLYYLSMEGVPQKGDAGYGAYTAELNETFDRDAINGVLRLNQVTVVYSERIG
ncbi:MAG: methyltransferase domain-containing protein [Oscillospiraceae bacterium]|jgi:ubiquinone/menaquinone biosynthesis C-methylase UbiE|nr:methyltransferase domain-containing protein [Oscillospiraceae bacterium]